ncbi:MAG TPA: hypothetical protein VM452_01015 [Caulifigura sp.]|nr:hypothetical protein [Caulifigura sp.]
MGGFWAGIFGLDAPDWTSGGAWTLEWLARPKGDKAFLLLAAGLGIAALLWFLYRVEGRLLSRGWRIALFSCRVAALLIAAAMLLEPVVVLSKEEQVPSHLIVLVDISGSMGLQDAWRDEAEATRVAKHFEISEGPNGLRKLTRAELARRILGEETIKRLAGDGARIVHVHPFNERLQEPVADYSVQAPKVSGESTALGAAIRQALATYSGSPLSGILILSDGQSNAGEPPASAAQLAVEAKLPIACIAIGTPDGPRNAQIAKVEVSPMAFVRDDNTLTVHITSRGMQDLTSTLTVEKRVDGGPWQELSREPVILQLEGAVQTFSVPFRETKPGKVEFKATLSGAGPELTEDDNVAHAETQVIRQKLQALLIAGATFPEIQFLRNSLIRDRGIELSSWLMSADKDFEHPADLPIQRLPITQEELDEYDCVILYDPDPAGFPPNFGDLLTNFVTKAGGGLVYIAGELQTSRIFDSQLDPALTWLQLLPVIREPGLFRSAVQTQLSSRQPWRLQMTEEGKHDPVLAFSDDAEANLRVIENLPGMYWHFPVTRAKPGATVLAVHGDPRMRNEHGPEVLIATQLVGPGRSMFIGFDSTYRWRFLDDQFFDGFWARVVDRAGRNKRLGGSYPFRLATPRSEYKPGANVKVIARFHNPDDVERTMSSLPGQVEHGDDEPVPITLNPEPEPGVFSGTFVATKAGPHFVKVWMGDDAVTGGVKAATLPLDITLPNLEFENPVVDRAALDSVALCTGGRTFDMTQGNEAADVFKIGRVKHLLEHRHEIWDAPILWVSLFVVLCLEWILRKRARLI